eukprot:scaffold125273_cov23-Tisochrysis_lutea.AAC.1
MGTHAMHLDQLDTDNRTNSCEILEEGGVLPATRQSHAEAGGCSHESMESPQAGAGAPDDHHVPQGNGKSSSRAHPLRQGQAAAVARFRRSQHPEFSSGAQSVASKPSP